MEGIILELIWTKLNASLSLTVVQDKMRGNIFNNGTVNGMIGEVLRGHFDYLLQFRSTEIVWQNEFYTHRQLSMCFITVKHEYTLQERLLKIAMDTNIILFLVAYLILILIFVQLQKNTFSKAALDLLRSCVGVSMLQQPSSQRARFIFILFIILLMLFNSFYQGWWYSELTVPMYKEYPKTEESLIDLDYKVYATKKFLTLKLSDRLIIVQDVGECIAAAIRDRSYKSACVEFCSLVRYYTAETTQIQIHEANDISKSYVVLITRDNFSLQTRFSTIFRYLQESGIQAYHHDYQEYFGFNRSVETVLARIITLEQLSISLTLLMYNFTFSCLVFLLELMYAYLSQKLF